MLASRTVAVTSEVWPLPNGGLAGTRTTAAMPVLEGEPAWSWTASSLPTTSLVAAADTAYLGLTDGVLVAIALDSGEERWRVPVPGLLESAPAVVDDRLYVGYRPGRLAALDRETGDTLWEADLGISISTTPVVVDGIVFVAANGLLAAFDAEDGAPIWRQSLSDTLVPVTPAIDDDTLAVATYDRVLIFDRSNGQQLTWVKLAPQHAPISAVAIIEDRIIVTANGQTLAIDEDMRRPWWDPIRPAWEFLHIVGAAPNPPWRPDLWTVALPANAYPAVVTSDVVTIATPSGALRAYDLQTGILRWESESEPVSAAPLGTPRGLLIAGLDTLRLLNSEGGTELSRISLDESPSSVVVVEWGAVVLSPGGVRAYLR